MNFKQELFIGIDIGGTNVKWGVIDQEGRIYKKASLKIAGLFSAAEVVNATALQIKSFMDESKSQFVGIGVGIPGLVDSKRGVVVRSGNLNWSDEPIVEMLKEHFNLQIAVTNDANAAALGEARFGIAKNYRHCVMITLGTGVGSGIIIDGKIFEGNCSAGGEIGHMVIEAFGLPCTCGNKGCFEAYASARALKEATTRAMIANPKSAMWEIGGIDQVSGKTAFQFAKTDESATKVVTEYLEYLAVGLTNICNILRPEAIILGGGVSQEGERLIEPLKQKMNARMFAGDCSPAVELIFANLKNDAGFIGAASLNLADL